MNKRKMNTRLIILFIGMLALSCSKSKDDRNPDFLPPVKIEIPDEVKSDPELLTLIESSEKAINEFSDNIEQLAIDGKEVFQKDEADYSLSDGIKAGKLMLQFVSNSTQIAATLEDFTKYIEKKQHEGMLDEKQEKALKQVAEILESRLDEIDKKYKDYFVKK